MWPAKVTNSTGTMVINEIAVNIFRPP